MASDSRKHMRCMWYNELGWPRINPTLEKKGYRPPVGCTRGADSCFYAHPPDPEWGRAKDSDVPKKFYGSRPRPDTPVPPEIRAQQEKFRRERERDRTPERSFRVKEEQLSPKLSFGPESESGRGYGRTDAHNIRTITPPRHASPPPLMSSTDRSRRDKRPYDWHDERQGGSSRPSALPESSGSRLREPHKITSSSRFERRDESVHSQESSSRSRAGESLLSRIQINDSQERKSDHRGGGTSPTRIPYREPFKEPSRSDRGYDQYRERARERDDHHAQEPPFDVKHDERRAVTPQWKTSSSSRATTPPWGSNSSMAPPSRPSNGTIPPPPQPPSFASMPRSESRQSNNAPRDIPPEKRRELWNERIILLSEAVSARTAQQHALTDLATLQKLAEGARSKFISTDAQKSMTQAIEMAKTRVEEEKKRQATVVEKMFSSDFWPIRVKREGGQGDENSLLELDNKIEEMKVQIMALAEDALKNDRVLREVVDWIGSRVIPTTIVDVVDPMEAERGLKRRRLDNGANVNQPSAYKTASVSSSATLVPTTAPEQLPTPVTANGFKTGADDAEVSTVMQRIVTISNRLKILEQSVATADEESVGRIQEYVDVEIEEFKKKFANKKGDHYTKRMAELKEEVESCGKDIKELAEELVNVIEDSVARNGEVSKLREEVQERSTTILQLESDLAKERAELSEIRIACKQTTEEIKALTAAFKLQVAKTKEITPPMMPSLEDLAALLEPQVKDSIREDVMGMMSKLRTEIVQLVQDQAVPLNSTFQEKLSKLTRLPEVLLFLSSNGDAGALGSPSGASRPP